MSSLVMRIVSIEHKNPTQMWKCRSMYFTKTRLQKKKANLPFRHYRETNAVHGGACKREDGVLTWWIPGWMFFYSFSSRCSAFSSTATLAGLTLVWTHVFPVTLVRYHHLSHWPGIIFHIFRNRIMNNYYLSCCRFTTASLSMVRLKWTATKLKHLTTLVLMKFMRNICQKTLNWC